MKREIYNQLLDWKKNKQKKPLIIKGARQVGKTYILKQFGESEFTSYLYVNFEERKDIHDLFKLSIVPQKIIENLALLYKKEIDINHTLIIFDEIQACPDALTSLKYFYEQFPRAYIIAAGSLLGVKLGESRGFPVGKVQYLEMYPLTFNEFLNAIGKNAYVKKINELNVQTPFSSPVHAELLDDLKTYLMVGGMPESVTTYREHKSLEKVRSVQKDLIASYQSDFAKYAQTSVAIKILTVWKSIPAQLSKENTKFIFSVAKVGARAREYESALIWLEDAGLILRLENVQDARTPLIAHKNRENFKIFLMDIGLLAAMCNLDPSLILSEEALFGTFKGAFIENYVIQELVANKKTSLAYWTSKGKAELDILLEEKGNIFPLEVKSGTNKKKKSLDTYTKLFDPQVRCRASKRNLAKDGNLINYPLYAISKIPEL